MLEGQVQTEVPSSVRDALLAAIVQCKDRAELGRKNEEKVKTVRAELVNYQVKLRELTECINYIVDEYKNVEQFLIDKKEVSLQMLESAITDAGMVVPDADTNGIHLSINDKNAKVLNNEGQDINLREGSAFRTVMGILMRYTLLKAQPDAIQMMLLDEAFSTLSDATAAVMREYLDAFKEDMLIVGIEQRNYLYEGIERTIYRVSKDKEKCSTVRKEN